MTFDLELHLPFRNMCGDMAEAESVRFKGRKRYATKTNGNGRKVDERHYGGKAYETYNGETRAAKTSPHISCCCTLKCSTRFRSMQQQRMFDEFYMP